jgi:DNA uptake protein ComE-like DNA-binding protein
MKIAQLFFAVFALSLITFSCQTSSDEGQNENANTEQTENEADTGEETAPATVFNANLATEADLNKIGLSSHMVAQILEERPFLTMNDFDAIVSPEENRDELYAKIFVPFNLNTTAEADFKMIPGVGDRMAHEFEEYRPYTSIQQFRREIGKYVDEAEVARYENYVFVPVELNSASEADIKALPGVGDRMAHEFEEYRPYTSMEQFRKEIGKYVDDKELARLERLVYIKE